MNGIIRKEKRAKLEGVQFTICDCVYHALHFISLEPLPSIALKNFLNWVECWRRDMERGHKYKYKLYTMRCFESGVLWRKRKGVKEYQRTTDRPTGNTKEPLN